MKTLICLLFATTVWAGWDAVYIEDKSGDFPDKYIEVFKDGSPAYRIRVEFRDSGCVVRDIDGSFAEAKVVDVLKMTPYSCRLEMWDDGTCNLIMRIGGLFLSPQKEVPCP